MEQKAKSGLGVKRTCKYFLLYIYLYIILYIHYYYYFLCVHHIKFSDFNYFGLLYSIFWVLERSEFRLTLKKEQEKQLKRYVEYFRHLPGLSNHYNEDKLLKIAESASVDEFNDRDHIIREGEIGKYCYIVDHGKVVIQKEVG